MKRLLTILSLLPFIGIALNAQSCIDAEVEKILSSLTLEEKIGQLNQLDGRKSREYICKQIREGKVSSLMNIVDPALSDSLQKIALTESRTGIPLIFARDIVHGFKTVLPIPLAQAASFDDDLVLEAARNSALEGTERGIRWAFGPMMDIARDSRWGRIAEGFGEDPYLASRLAASVVRGYQGADLSDETSMAACAKHFAGYGASEAGKDYNNTYIPQRQLYDVYFPPFKASVRAGIASFMSSFNDIDGVPSTGNRWLLTDVLRGEWGFSGLVVSDWGSVGGLVPHGASATKKEAAATCLHAGCDMDMESKSYLVYMKSLIEEGVVSMADLDQAARRVLRMKYMLGLFDHPYARKSDATSIYSQPVLETACRLAEESSVLLKNEGVLPLSSDVRTVLITGPMANAAYDQMGTWALDGEKAQSVTPLAAFREMLPQNVNLLYEAGLDFPRDSSAVGIRKAAKAARKADVVIAFVGEEQMMTGEAHSLSNLHLQGYQTDLLEALAETGKPLVTVVLAGRPLVIGDETEMSDAVLYMWHPGTMGGKAAYRLLWGESNPSGKLPVTFPRTEGQIPLYYNHKHTSHKAKGHEGDLRRVPREQPQSVMGHTSSYLDVPVSPLFPFGFGLSYTSFLISDLNVLIPSVKTGESVKLQVKVTNTGKRDGTEVVQLYCGRKSASVTRPMKELKSYQRIDLKAGESRTVAFEIPVESLAFCRSDYTWGTEPGTYTVTVGSSSADPGQSGKFVLAD